MTIAGPRGGEGTRPGDVLEAPERRQADAEVVEARFQARRALACIVLAAAATLVGAAAPALGAACGDGRWVTAATSLLNAELQAIVIENGQIRIGAACASVPAKLKGRKKTKVLAVFGACAGFAGKVRLKATIEPGCGFMKGKVTGKRARLSETFTAPRCGDGVVDGARGEPCDGASGCGPAEVCGATLCRCVASTPTTTSTSLPPGATTTTTVPPFRYIMFSGAETGSAEEYTEDNLCLPVHSPVRSGSWACQVALGSFAALRPHSFSERTVYVRAYHRIDVVTPPAVESFNPVFVMDVTPSGKCVADVGVAPDGVNIRYRLRNRNTGTDLGFSPPMPAGAFYRVELSTTIGPGGTGTAELRIDGVTVASATGQDFGTQNLDAVFISNNPSVPLPGYTGANGGDWIATFDDMAITVGGFPGPGRVIARQGAPIAPTYDQWTKIPGGDVEDVWSETPPDAAMRAETPFVGTPLAQTLRVARFDQGVDPITATNEIKACQTWLNMGLVGTTIPDRAYAFRRRLGDVDTDTPVVDFSLPDSGQQNKLRSDGLLGGFFAATLAELATAEIGAVKSGPAGGTALRVTDAWLSCEYE